MAQTQVDKLLKARQAAYRKIFNADNGDLNESAKTTLADLRVFCNATKSIFNSDPLEMARLAGRQEVFQRIANFLNIDYSEFYQLEENYDY